MSEVSSRVATLALTDIYYEQPVADALVRDLGHVRSVGFTGTSEPVSLVQLEIVGRLLTAFRNASRGERVEFHHGDCVESDEHAARAAHEAGLWVVGHPPTNPYKRAFVQCDELRDEYPYLIRNGHIVAESDVLVATPQQADEQVRSGTWATVRRARKAGLPVVLVTPRDVRVEHPEQPTLG